MNLKSWEQNFLKILNLHRDYLTRLPLYQFDNKLDIFPLMCATDTVWITKLTLSYKNISFIPKSHAQVYTYTSICGNTHYDDVDKNNNDSSKRLDTHYHKYHSSS